MMGNPFSLADRAAVDATSDKPRPTAIYAIYAADATHADRSDRRDSATGGSEPEKPSDPPDERHVGCCAWVTLGIAGGLSVRSSDAQSSNSEALCRTRTGDPFLTMEVLYRLS
jgi:hypothetical protein